MKSALSARVFEFIGYASIPCARNPSGRPLPLGQIYVNEDLWALKCWVRWRVCLVGVGKGICFFEFLRDGSELCIIDVQVLS